MHLLKENTLEADELLEIVDRLASLVEEYKQVDGDSDQSEDEEDRDEEDDYWGLSGSQFWDVSGSEWSKEELTINYNLQIN